MIFIILLIVTQVLQLFLPWWSALLGPFIVCLWMGQSGKQAFTLSFLANLAIWLGASLFMHLNTEGVLTARVAGLFQLPAAFWLIVITVLIGALVSGLGGWAGYAFKKILNV